MKTHRVVAMLGAALMAVAGSALAQEYEDLPLDQEIKLAMSAGPPTISRDADIYVFGASGFERAVEGRNEWSCLVVRSAADSRQLAPMCLNPFATRSVLPAYLVEGQLQREGMAQGAIEEELLRRFDRGELPTPEGPAYTYMLSSGQRIGPNAGQFKPHFMLYMPGATNELIGGDPGNQAFPFVGPFEGHPLATVVIIMDEFVHPDDMVIPGT
ncbi:MAG: hypothetical protein HKN73_14080 [Gemmatimonadetes bacterium]|nr:hypothetical protein [Gemmatimonadota bacterium]